MSILITIIVSFAVIIGMFAFLIYIDIVDQKFTMTEEEYKCLKCLECLKCNKKIKKLEKEQEINNA